MYTYIRSDSMFFIFFCLHHVESPEVDVRELYKLIRTILYNILGSWEPPNEVHNHPSRRV